MSILGKYRNRLDAELTVTQFAGGSLGGMQVIGSLWVAEQSDDLLGNRTLLVTEEGLRDAGYERVSE